MKLLLTADQLQRRVPGGIGTYIRGLTGQLVLTDEVTWWGARSKLPFLDIELKERHSALPLPLMVKAWDLGIVKPPDAYDFVHATSMALPPRPAFPMSVMVHDLAWRHFPEAFPDRGRRWHEAALQRAIQRADLFFTPSAATAGELAEMGIASERIIEVVEGADHLPHPDNAGADEVLATNAPGGRFLLAVGTLEPRKNLRRLFAAYAATKSQLPEPWPLLVVGPAGWGGDVEVPEGVVAVGSASPAVIAELYRRCEVFLSVPLLEGWGLPVAEAMAMGAPVVSSPVPSAGDGTELVNPVDVDDIAAAILRVVSDPPHRQALVERGRHRASQLTWSASAAQHFEGWKQYR